MRGLPLPFRSLAAAWLVVPGVVLAALFAVLQPFTDVEGYWIGATSSATIYCLFSCGLGALASAVEANKIRRARVLMGASARGPLSVVLASSWPTLLMALIIQSTGFVFVTWGSWGSPGRFPWEVIVAWLAMIMFHMMLGTACGLALPVVFAAPLALIASYVWIGFTWSVPFIPIRYLSGLAISGCCAVYADLDPNAIISIVVFCTAGVLAGTLVIASLGHLGRWGLALRSGVVIVCLGLGAFAGLGAASVLGPYPSPPRSSSDLECSKSDGSKICFFPEQLWNVSPSPVTVVEGALAELRSADIPVPSRVTGALLDKDRGSAIMLYRRDFAEDATLHSFSNAYATVGAADCTSNEAAFLSRNMAVAQITGVIFWYSSGGRDDPFVVEPSVERLKQLKSAELVRWISETLQAGATCQSAMPEIPLP